MKDYDALALEELEELKVLFQVIKHLLSRIIY
jgi:hypothetical protein